MNSGPGCSGRVGGHGEGLRRNRGEATGIELGASLNEWSRGERGNHPRLPSPRAANPVVGRSVADLRPLGGAEDP